MPNHPDPESLAGTDVPVGPTSMPGCSNPPDPEVVNGESCELLPNSIEGAPEKTKQKHNGSFFSSFEPPNRRLIFLHIFFCIAAYPILMVYVIVANKKSLFWARFAVAAGCETVGLAFGYTLSTLGEPLLDAPTWATILHLSQAQTNPGIKLKDLAAVTQPAGYFAAARLLWARSRRLKTSRLARKAYDRQIWTAYILYFLLLVILSTLVSFTLGRLIDIEAFPIPQSRDYEEVLINGTVSDADYDRFRSRDSPGRSWLPSTFAWNRVPLAVSFPFKNNTIYFAEETLSGLLPGGNGFGTFKTDNVEPSTARASFMERLTEPRDQDEPVKPSQVLRYPKWGVRVHCVKLPNPETQLIPKDKDNNNNTRVSISRQTIVDLFAYFEIHLEDEQAGRNPFELRATNDQTVNVQSVDYGRNLTHPNLNGNGLATVETVLVRTGSQGTFPHVVNWPIPGRISDDSGNRYPRANQSPVPEYTRVGYDCIVCIHLFEFWIVETYNGTNSAPFVFSLISPGNVIQDKGLSEHQFGRPVTANAGMNTSVIALNILGSNEAIQNSKYITESDAYGDMFHTAPATVIRWTDGGVNNTYTELNPGRYASYKGNSIAVNILPFLAGSGGLVARRYTDRVVAIASIRLYSMLTFLVGVLIIGLVAGLFVPKLPLETRRRDFQLYSWFALFRGNELVCMESEARMEHNMELKDIEEEWGELRFRLRQPQSDD